MSLTKIYLLQPYVEFGAITNLYDFKQYGELLAQQAEATFPLIEILCISIFGVFAKIPRSIPLNEVKQKLNCALVEADHITIEAWTPTN